MNSMSDLKTEPLLSVVIITYNRGKILLSSLEALALQTYRKELFEVIVVVDGSTDNTMEILAKFSPDFRLKFLYQKNSGASSARNKGAKEAIGKIALFLDDDIIADKELLSEHAQHKRKEPMILLGKIGVHPSSPENFLKAGLEKWSDEQFSKLEKEGYKFSFKDIYFANASIDRKLFLRLGGFDETFNSYGEEDRELALRLLKSGVSPVYNPKALGYQYYDKDFKKYCEDFFSVGKADLKFYLKHGEMKQQLRFSKYYQNSKKIMFFKKLFISLPDFLSINFYFLKSLMQIALKMGLKGTLFGKIQVLTREFYYLKGLRKACGSKESFINLINGV